MKAPRRTETGGAGRDAGSGPPALPLVTSVQEFGLSLDELRDLVLWELRVLPRLPPTGDGAGMAPEGSGSTIR